jgi:hypothetical protein
VQQQCTKQRKRESQHCNAKKKKRTKLKHNKKYGEQAP